MEIHVQQAQNVVDWYQIGTTSTVKYTIIRGQPVYIGEDADGNANRVIPTTDVSEHKADGIALTATADTAYSKNKIGVALFPCRILTDNVDPTNPPEAAADAVVYLLDAGTWSDTDTNSGGHAYGTCTQVVAAGDYSGLYELNLTGMDET